MPFSSRSKIDKKPWLPDSWSMRGIRFVAPTVLLVTFCAGLIGCHSPNPSETSKLMPTPLLYDGKALNPFSGLDEARQTPHLRLFYATNRAPDSRNSGYANGFDERLHLGTVTVRFGGESMTWPQLKQITLDSYSTNVVPLQVRDIQRRATWGGADLREAQTPDDTFFQALNQHLKKSPRDEILLYVHGTKVSFYHANILAAELNHFAGRAYTALAYSWPSHQSAFRYFIRQDVERAHASATPLRLLLERLAEESNASKVHIICYSAGGKVLTRALHELRNTYPDLTPDELKERFRIGTVVCAAIDVSFDHFLERLPAMSDIAKRIAITVTDDDYALHYAKLLMGGRDRASTEEALEEEERFIQEHHLTNVELIDVSIGKQSRGFDIVGHHYWYRHPWMSSDLMMLLTSGLPAGDRGLEPGELAGVWFMAGTYPTDLKKAANRSRDQK